MRRLLLGCLLFHLICRPLSAQQILMNDNSERNFALEVKQMDEFFERFNNDKNTLLRTYIRKKYPTVRIDRLTLLKSLFNQENKNWNIADLNAFYRKVNDSLHPVYLDFNRSDWYASVLCRFIYKGKPINLRMTLNIRQSGNGGLSWIISGAFSPTLQHEAGGVSKAPAIAKGRKFLNPISHATDFIGLSKAMSDPKNINDYLDSSFYRKPYSLDFLNSLKHNELRFEYVLHITYYFFQVKDWVFTVNHYQRNSTNSGWLISRLMKASDDEKKIYKTRLYQDSF
ncbi:MAG: hypothetical protein Q8918_12090 [Bacteroidota bacterium]|nr:hypothetical protein [Bacteroidota bacterium]MDP4250841.1 hypothetical protein [Bacteroidota bacterium]